MPAPDFSKQTIDTLARRARFQCSNPDCGVHTTGPNSDPDKATTIGEAAHIFGAKPGSMRYDPAMSDVTRAEITNGIWLCGNCHAKVDRDAVTYPTELLFVWRKEHEDRTMRELGTVGERLRYEVEAAQFDFLRKYPQIIQRIAIDKPVGWEWRLAAELTRYLNKGEFKRLQNIRDGHYFKAYPQVHNAEFLPWLIERTHIMANLAPPLVHLFDRLTASFGKPGEPGDMEEIHDVCVLIHDMLVRMVDCEEIIRFTGIPEEGEELRGLLIDAVGANAEKLRGISNSLDKFISMINTDHGGTTESPRVLTWTVVFDLPENFENKYAAATSRYEEVLARSMYD